MLHIGGIYGDKKQPPQDLMILIANWTGRLKANCSGNDDVSLTLRCLEFAGL